MQSQPNGECSLPPVRVSEAMELIADVMTEIAMLDDLEDVRARLKTLARDIRGAVAAVG